MTETELEARLIPEIQRGNIELALLETLMLAAMIHAAILRKTVIHLKEATGRNLSLERAAKWLSSQVKKPRALLTRMEKWSKCANIYCLSSSQTLVFPRVA